MTKPIEKAVGCECVFVGGGGGSFSYCSDHADMQDSKTGRNAVLVVACTGVRLLIIIIECSIL